MRENFKTGSRWVIEKDDSGLIFRGVMSGKLVASKRLRQRKSQCNFIQRFITKMADSSKSIIDIRLIEGIKW
ncbi:MAG: hypothetical protein D6690_13415 [Nitrospirae bacterium]|nr:MAG: hypothetical protein D6690_13415 [Nitrospirota bacterium]